MTPEGSLATQATDESRDPSTHDSPMTHFWRKSLQALRDGFDVDGKRAVLEGQTLQSMEAAPFVALFGLLQRLRLLEPAHACECASAIWGVLTSYVTLFPPRFLSPVDTEELVTIACACLDSMDVESARGIAAKFWDAESDEHRRWGGENCILRAAAGVFPRTIGPLLRLLVALSVSERTAYLAYWTLEHGLESITELSQGYANHLISDGNEHEALLNIRSIRKRNSSNLEKILTVTSPSEAYPVFVQANASIPSNSYRPSIPERSFGCGCEESGAVTWAIRWNGWGAIYEILNLFVRQIRQHASSTRFAQLDLDIFLVSATSVLEFIEHLCIHCSDEVRNFIAFDMKMLPILCDLFVELADPVDGEQLTWLTKPLRDEYLFKTSSCLAALVLRDIRRSKFVLDAVFASKDNVQPLRVAISVLGVTCFPAISAMISVAGSYHLETHLSHISWVAPSSAQNDALIDPYGSAAIMKFLTEFVLPTWNSAGPRAKMIDLAAYAWWDLPADFFTFMRGASKMSLNSPHVAKTIAKIINKATSSSVEKESPMVIFSIIRALRACLLYAVDCLKFFQEEFFNGRCEIKDLSHLVKTLLNPDTVHGLAMICSGCAPLLDEKLISTVQAQGPGYFRIFESHYVDVKGGLAVSASDLKTNIEDSAAETLHRFVRVVEICSDNGDVAQIPWPTLSDSVVPKRRTGGRKLREGIAKRLDGNGSIACADFLISILTGGQRGAARALFSPLPTESSTDKKGDEPKETNGPDKTAVPDGETSEDNCILVSVVKFIRNVLENWYSWMTEDEQNIGMQDLRVKRISCASKYIRFLTILWDSPNSYWFQQFWETENVWALLAEVLKCEGPSNSTRFNIALAAKQKMLTMEPLSQDNRPNSTWQDITMDASNEVDEFVVWRQTAADVLTLFASEILVCAGKTSKLVADAQSDDAESKSKAKKIGEDLFAEPQFVAFGAVFSEKWMHVLLNPEDWLMIHKQENDDVSARLNLDELSWKNVDTLEWLTANLLEEFAQLIRFDNKKSGMSVMSVIEQNDSEISFGSNYKFDIRKAGTLLKRANVDTYAIESFINRLVRVNQVWARVDVQLSLTKAYAAMAYSVVFADAFAPVPGKALSYASPQFCGKLCRCLSRYLVSLRSPSHFSGRTLEAQHEMAQLLSFLSARLSQEELEQPLLTPFRFDSELDDENNCVLKKNALGQICFAIDRILPLTREGILSLEERERTVDIVKSLLVTASYLNRGIAFRDDVDIAALESTCFDVLKVLRKNSRVAQSAATAIISLQSCEFAGAESLFLDTKIAKVVFDTISTLENEADCESSIAEATSSLLLMLAQMMLWLPDSSETKKLVVQYTMQNISGGCVSVLFPRGDIPIPTYNPATLKREPTHITWCASLSLATFCMKHRPDDVERHEQDVLEFAASNLPRICSSSLNLHGDWPLGNEEHQHATIARVEEAEIAAETLFQLSYRAIELVNKLPELTRISILELLAYVRLVHKLLRFEPIERWIKPVSEQEKFRSEFTKQGKDVPAVSGSFLLAGSSSWAHSPQTPSVHGSPPLRSPRQTIMTAIGGSGGRTPVSASRHSPYAPPSPVFLNTPARSPMVMSSRGPSTLSPLSPWTPHGAGLISEGGLLFGEECCGALLRGLNSALGTLRNFGKAFGEPFIDPTMHKSNGPLDFGTLVALMYYCVSEIHRGPDIARFNLYTQVVENCLQLAITHLSIYEERGVLESGFRNEVANKLSTVVGRLRKVVPPMPTYSLVHTEEIDPFIQSLQQLL